MPSLFAPPATPAPGTSTAVVRPAPPPAEPSRASALLGWAALSLTLVVGVPLFLCLPFWFDVYHYDICAVR